MVYVGIDYGTRKTGIAVSDASNSLAFPRDTIATQELPQYLQHLAPEIIPEAIVVGYSDSGSSVANPLMRDITLFVETLRKEFDGIPIHLENEYATSAHSRALNDFVENKPRNQARKSKQSDQVVDAQAAALILQRFLEKRRAGGVSILNKDA